MMTEADVISRYTRAQALEDGVLVDASAQAKEAGFSCDVAFTAAAWADCVTWTDADSNLQVYQDVEGRLWDVLYMAGCAARAAQEATALRFTLYRVPRDGIATTPVCAALRLVVGPGDDGECVITVMLPGET